MDVKEQIALSILKGAGGDVDKDYTSTDAIYRDVESIYRSQDNRQDVESLQVELIDNGLYTYDDRNTQGYKPVEINVNVPVEDYYNSGFENGIEIQKAKLEAITITENGIYNKEDGYDEVEVNIDTQSYYDNGYEIGYGEGVDVGIQEQKNKLQSIRINENGIYEDENGYRQVEVALDIPKTKIYNGFRFEGTGDNDYQYFKDIDFSQYDWSGVYDTAEFFSNIKSNDGGGLMASDFDNFIENFNGEMVSCYNMFKETAIKELPNFGELTKNCVRLEEMLCMSYIEDVSNLQYWNTSNVTDMTKTFYACSNLKSVPSFNTENVITMKDTFESCNRLEEVGDLNTKNVVNMEQLFHKCESLIKSPELNTENASNMKRMYCQCRSITHIPLLDCGSCTDIQEIFSDSAVTLAKLTDLGGFKDLGKQSSLTGTEMNGFLRNAPYLTHESLMNVINNLYDRKSAGYSTISLMVGSLNLEKLTEDDIQVAINKGWNIVL